MGLFSGDFFDLDEIIEKKYGNISDYFQKHGETEFRRIENESFKNLVDTHEVFICSLGAGFDLSLIDSKHKVIWVRRDSDNNGRIFLNRPRLNIDQSPLAEYQSRAQLREVAYRNRADYVYTLPEGKVISGDIERQMLADILERVKGLPASTKFVGDISNLGIECLAPSQLQTKFSYSFLEIRSDLWTLDQVKQIEKSTSYTKKIYSLRHEPTLNDLNYECWDYLDWDVKYGNCAWKDIPAKKLILSTHENNITDAIKSLELAEAQSCGTESFMVTVHHEGSASPKEELQRVNLKLCPVVDNWSELMIGYKWWLENPKQRNFLPRSVDGRWNWFRLWMRGRQKLNFIRQGVADFLDQPTLFQWLSTGSSRDKFAAVIGNPIRHSYSPSFHRDFFAQKGISFFSIQVAEAEFTVAMETLKELGLAYVAVTAPLKKQAYLIAKNLSDIEKSLESINTLTWEKNRGAWVGNNTDKDAFSESVSEAFSKEMKIDHKNADIDLKNNAVVWGGGGTTSIIKAVFPQAQFVKARSGINGAMSIANSETIGPAILVWASPRSNEVILPPENWRPKIVVDLSYQENSMGLEYAEKCKAMYVSGYRMFELQALAQQKIWSSYL